TGTADLALAYWSASRAMPGVDVVGVDFCQPMLALGAAKSRRWGAQSRVCLIDGDAEKLPFPDNLFQIVSVAFGLRNVSDPQAGLKEMCRVCRSAGQVAVLEFSEPQGPLLKMLYNYYFQRILPRIGQTLARNSQAAYNYLPESVGRFPQGEDFARLMRLVGLTDVTFYPFTFGIATLYVGKKG
ncbi:MAG: ubiquinone/menaquinone biosynthesis methyltransferase, partial [Thermoguttaceae bacterium]